MPACTFGWTLTLLILDCGHIHLFNNTLYEVRFYFQIMPYWRFKLTCVFHKMYMVYLVWTILNSARGDNCPDACICEGTEIWCDGIIPENIPAYINNVKLFNLKTDEFVSRRLCSVSWSHNISQLSFDELHTNPFTLPDDFFVCLDTLKRLKLHYGKLENLSSRTFNGLNTLSTLDLSGCDQVYAKDLYTALMPPSILPELSTLILVQTGRHKNLEPTQELIDELGKREFREVDLSRTVILFKPVNIDPVCDTLRAINLSYTTFDSETEWDNRTKECDSLQVLDISGMNYPRTHIGPSNLSISNVELVFDYLRVFKVIPTSFFRSIRKLFINSIMGPDHHIRFSNSTFTVEMNNSLTEVHMSKCGFNLLDVEVFVKHNNIQYIDLSFNEMEAISPKFFSNMHQLTNVDLSMNKLSEMDQNAFSKLFAKNLLLEEVNLSGNNLNEMPVNMFVHNRAIEYLDLSSNDLQQIIFEIKQLLNLSELIMSKNLITYLNTASRKRLDDLYNLKCKTNCNHSSFTVDLQENPFSCGCESLEFIEWFISSPMFDESRSMYSCKFDGQKYSMGTDALAVAKHDCELPFLKLKHILCEVLIPMAVVVFISVCSYCVYKVAKKRHQNLEYEELRTSFCEYPDEKIPVFLSFSHDDRDTVHKNIHGPMSVSNSWQSENFGSIPESSLGCIKGNGCILLARTGVRKKSILTSTKNASLIITVFLAMLYEHEQPRTAYLCRDWASFEIDFNLSLTS